LAERNFCHVHSITAEEAEAAIIEEKALETIGGRIELDEDISDTTARLINLLLSGRVEGVTVGPEREREIDGRMETIPPAVMLHLESAVPEDMPVWVLDASPSDGDVEMLKEEIDGLERVEISAYNPDARLWQDFGSMWSRKKITTECDQWREGNRDTRTGRLIQMMLEAHDMGKEWAVITHKNSALIDLLLDLPEHVLPTDPRNPDAWTPWDRDGNPDRCAWFGNLRGLNRFEEVDVLFVVGSQMKPSWAYDEEIARYGYDWLEVDRGEEHVMFRPSWDPPHGAYHVPYSASQPVTTEGEHMWHRAERSEVYQAIMRARPLDGTPVVIACTHVDVDVPEMPTTYEPYLMWREDDWKSILDGVEKKACPGKPGGYPGKDLSPATVAAIREATDGSRPPESNTTISERLGVDRDTVSKYQVLTPEARKMAWIGTVLEAKESGDEDRSWKVIATEVGMSTQTLRNLRKRWKENHQ
jgi:hypothetical protein